MHGDGLGVVAGKQAAVGQRLLNLLLLGLQCGNRGRQGFQLALILVAELLLGAGRGVGAACDGLGFLLGGGLGLRGFGHGLAAARLLHPVRHATFVFTPVAGTFPGNRAGDHVVEEGAVVADQKDRAVIALQQVFQHVQRLDVQIVGRLVQHQNIGRPRKQTGQQQAVALAA